MDKSNERKVNLQKLTLIELKEILERENGLAKNKSLLRKLPDKGESIIKFRDKVEAEIKHRESVEALEASFATLSVNVDLPVDKHTEKIFVMEKPEKKRFIPGLTLQKEYHPKAGHDSSKFIEDAKYFNKQTQRLSLPESVGILKKQDERTKEEQIRNKTAKEMEQLEELGKDDESASNSSNESDSDSTPDDDKP